MVNWVQMILTFTLLCVYNKLPKGCMSELVNMLNIEVLEIVAQMCLMRFLHDVLRINVIAWWYVEKEVPSMWNEKR